MTDYTRHTTGPDIDPDRTRPLYEKFYVERIDGSVKHNDCDFYVLDLVHDKFSVPALRAYAVACRDEYPQLAEDILTRLDQHEAGSNK